LIKKLLVFSRGGPAGSLSSIPAHGEANVGGRTQARFDEFQGLDLSISKHFDVSEFHGKTSGAPQICVDVRSD